MMGIVHTGARSGMKRSPRTSTNLEAIAVLHASHLGISPGHKSRPSEKSIVGVAEDSKSVY